MIIAIGSMKGGVSKSTTAAYLGTALKNMGYKVAAIDADDDDEARTLLHWSLDEGLPFTVYPLGHPQKLKKQIKALNEKVDYALVDLPPNKRDYFIEAAYVCDLFILVTTSSPTDINRLEPSIEYLADIEEERDLDFARILITRYSRQGVNEREVLEEFKDYPIFKTKISEKKIYQHEFGKLPKYTFEYANLALEVVNEY